MKELCIYLFTFEARAKEEREKMIFALMANIMPSL